MTGPVPLLLMGYGRRGRQWHERCRARSDVVVVGVVEPDEEARAAAASAGLAVFDTPAAAACVQPTRALPVGAIVASTLDSHPQVAAACLTAGLSVLVEKPLALSVAAATTVVQAAADRHLVALVVQNFRYLRREQAVTRALAEGLVGRPCRADVESSRVVRSPDALWDFAIHHFDAFRIRLGQPPATITAAPHATALDVVLTWADGFELHYRHDDAAPGYRYRERLVGTDGALTVDDQRVRLERDGRRARTVRPAGRRDPDDAVLDEFLAALAGARSALAAADNLLTVATVAAVATAMREGGTVRVTVDHG